MLKKSKVAGRGKGDDAMQSMQLSVQCSAVWCGVVRCGAVRCCAVLVHCCRISETTSSPGEEVRIREDETHYRRHVALSYRRLSWPQLGWLRCLQLDSRESSLLEDDAHTAYVQYCAAGSRSMLMNVPRRREGRGDVLTVRCKCKYK